MEAPNITLLDSKPSVLHGTKRKRATQFTTYFPRALHTISPRFPRLCLAFQKHGKCRRLEDCEGRVVSCGFTSKGSLLLCYSNFKKTGIPKRIMYYEKGEWTDFSHDLIASIRKDLNTKKPAIEVEIDGRSLVLDFLHMFQLQLETGVMHPIAWIDETDCCFFPEAFTGGDEACQCCEHEYANDQEYMFSESSSPHENKLQLEIDINGVEQPKLKECNGESSSSERHFLIVQKPASSSCALEVEDYCNRDADGKPDKAVEDIKETDIILVPEKQFVDVQFNEQLDASAVENLFLMGLNTCGGVDILDIRPCSSTQYRLERFKQVQIMKKYRGTANVQRAWLASSKAALSTIMMHGLVHCGLSSIPHLYGSGIHLAASECTNLRLEVLHRFCYEYF